MDGLLPRCIPVDIGDNNGATPLMCAATRGEEQLVTKLIEYGADVTASNSAGITALHTVAAAGQKPEMITLLIAKGASVDAETLERRFTPLHQASLANAVAPYRTDSVGMMERLLRAGANIEARVEDQRTPLLVAVFDGKDECVRYLLEAGANIEAKDENGMTSLCYAAELGRLGSLSTATILVERGANKEARNQYGWTALCRATRNSNIPMVRLLLEHGCDKEATDEEGWTILDHAISVSSLPLVQLLIKDGANIESTDEHWFTPLHRAVLKGDLTSTELLLDHGANVGSRNNWDSTPLHMAVTRGDICMVKVLLKHGADPCARATNDESKSLMDGGGIMPSGYNETNPHEFPDPKRDEIKIVLQEAEKAWKSSGTKTST